MSVQQWLRGWRVLSVLAALMLAGAAPPARAAVTIDFGTDDVEKNVPSPYQEDGFNVAGVELELDGYFGNPSSAIRFDFTTPTLTISTISGANFSLISFDRYCECISDPIMVSGEIAGNGPVGPTVVSSTYMWQTASGFAGFTNLTSLTLSVSGEEGNHLDNIVLEVVPLPAALPLLATALAGLGLARYRRRRAAA